MIYAGIAFTAIEISKYFYYKNSVKNKICILGIEPYCKIKDNYVKIEKTSNQNDNDNDIADSIVEIISNKMLEFLRKIPLNCFVFFRNIIFAVLDDNPKIKN